MRTAQEFEQGAIPKAINIDFFNTNSFNTEIAKLNMNEPVYLYCRSENRSQRAAAILSEAGFKHIFDLKGGYMRWPFKN